MLIGRSRVTLVNDSGKVQMMQLKLSAIELRDDTPRLAEFGIASNPPIGSDAVAVFIGGDRSNGVVIATGHQQSRPTGLAPGETKIYCQDGKFIYFTASGGIVIEANGQAVTVSNSTSVTINASTQVIMNTPLLKVSGDIIDNYGTNTHNMAATRAIYNKHTHDVDGVQGGSSTVVSDIPNQPE